MKKQDVKITAVTEVFGTGQKITGVILEYPAEVDAQDIKAENYRVENRRISCVHVSDSYRGLPKRRGRFVNLTLNPEDELADTRVRIGAGPHGRMDIRDARAVVSQSTEVFCHKDRGECVSLHKCKIPPFEKRKNQGADNGVADCFQVRKFQVSGTDRELEYNLFIPDSAYLFRHTDGKYVHVNPDEKYPLVLFIHDAGSCSDKAGTALAQGNGGVVWARDEEQRVRPCFVVAPHYPSACANDEFEVTWEADATIELVKQIAREFPVDTSRIYGTGQSMGCMMLCELLLRNLDFFAGCLLVAGQWNPKTMAAASGQKLWAVVAQKDAKAFPIMGDCFDAMEECGALVSRGHVDAKADASLIRETLAAQRAQGDHLFFTWFEGDSILPEGEIDFPGNHHIYTWAKAYDIEFLREWLFEQRKESV